jgi:carboxymethylenebutenolidase
VTVWVVGGVLALIVLFVGFLAVSVALDSRGSEERLAEVTNAVIPGGAGPDVPAYVATPKGAGPHPVVLMVHEFWGLNPDIVSKADLLAEEGYLVVAPNVFRRGTTGWLPSAIYQVIVTPAEEVNEDLDAVLAWVRTQPGADATRVGITGFCFGGRTSLLYSLHNPTLSATSVFYGQPVTDPARLSTLGGPVLGIFGGADTSIPLEDVRAFERGLVDAGVESTVTVYPDQPHAFVKNAEEIATDPVQGAAWEQMVRFFDAALKNDARTGSVPGSTTLVGDFYGWGPLARLMFEHVGHASPWASAPHGH